jgi:urease accessory protein
MLDAAPAAHSEPAHPVAQPPLPRIDGAVVLRFRERNGRTFVSDRGERGSARLRLPRMPDDVPPEAVFINLGGGLTDGDHLTFDLALDAAARATCTGQAAEKIFRSRGAPSVVTTNIRLAEAAGLAWLPQESILFDGANLRRQINVEMDGTARFVGCEAAILGRVARGERVRTGTLIDRWRVRVDGRLVWADSLQLTGAVDSLAQRTGLLDGGRAFGTVVYAGADAEILLAAVRELVADLGETVRAGVSLRPGLLLLRFIAGSGQPLREALAQVLPSLREAAGAGPRAMPRVWAC